MKFIFAGKEREIKVKLCAKIIGLMFVAMVGVTIFDLATDTVPHDPDYVYSLGQQIGQFIGLFICYFGFAAVGYMIRKEEEKKDD